MSTNQMKRIATIFFGSTSDSLLVLDALANLQLTTYNLQPAAVVTQPARPVGRKQIITPTPVETWAKENNIPVLTFPHQKEKPWLFENEHTVIDTLQPFKADLLISASFGQKIPVKTIRSATFGGLNVHPSLLPRWRGADPVPWAILSGDHQTGVTIVTLAEAFDEGKIIAQQKYPITDKDASDPLRTQLFKIGADLLITSLPNFLSGNNKGSSQQFNNVTIQQFPYARRFTRDDGFEPWENIQNPKEAERIERKFRALHPWPGLWTMLDGKRLKILSCHRDPHLILDTVQWEGKNPQAYLAS